MFSTKNERLGLLIATIIFGLLALVQLGRAFTNTPVSVGGTVVPVWASIVFGLIGILMAFWMGAILRRKRPLV